MHKRVLLPLCATAHHFKSPCCSAQRYSHPQTKWRHLGGAPPRNPRRGEACPRACCWNICRIRKAWTGALLHRSPFWYHVAHFCLVQSTSAWCNKLQTGGAQGSVARGKAQAYGTRLEQRYPSQPHHTFIVDPNSLPHLLAHKPPRPGTRSGSQPCHVLKTVQPKKWLAAWKQGPHSQRPCRAGTARSTFWRVPDMLQITHP